MIYPVYPVPNIKSKEKTHRPINRTQFEANYTQISPKMTRSKMQFTLKYDELELTDYLMLRTFFNSHTGENLSFTHPVFGTSHTVYIDMDDMDGDFISPTTVTTQMILTEV